MSYLNLHLASKELTPYAPCLPPASLGPFPQFPVKDIALKSYTIAQTSHSSPSTVHGNILIIVRVDSQRCLEKVQLLLHALGLLLATPNATLKPTNYAKYLLLFSSGKTVDEICVRRKEGSRRVRLRCDTIALGVSLLCVPGSHTCRLWKRSIVVGWGFRCRRLKRLVKQLCTWR